MFLCLYLLFVLDYHNSILSLTLIGLVISASDDWQEMGDKMLDKL